MLSPRRSLVVVALLVVTGCASAPPNLSRQGVAAFNATRIIGGLDLLRDSAIAANAQIPPLVSTDTTRKIVTYHRSALLVIHDYPAGWMSAVVTGLNETVADLPPSEAQLLAPYVALVHTILQGVTP